MGTPAQDVIDLTAQRTTDQAALAQLQADKTTLESNLITARNAARTAEADVDSAKAMKRSATSMNDIESASAALKTAEQTYADACELIDNIERALRSSAEAIQQATFRFQSTTQALWRAHGDVFAAEAKSDPNFNQIRERIIKTYICLGLGGAAPAFSHMLSKRFFADQNGMAVDIDEGVKEGIRNSLKSEFGL